MHRRRTLPHQRPHEDRDPTVQLVGGCAAVRSPTVIHTQGHSEARRRLMIDLAPLAPDPTALSCPKGLYRRDCARRDVRRPVEFELARSVGNETLLGESDGSQSSVIAGRFRFWASGVCPHNMEDLRPSSAGWHHTSCVRDGASPCTASRRRNSPAQMSGTECS